MKMKKTLCILFAVIVLASCGPKRLGCGPGRCEVTKLQTTDSRDC